MDYTFLTNESKDGPLDVAGCRCKGCGNSISLICSVDSSSTALCILIQQQSTVSHFDLNIYCANAKKQAIPEDTTNDKKTSLSIIILKYYIPKSLMTSSNNFLLILCFLSIKSVTILWMSSTSLIDGLFFLTYSV